MSHAQSDRMSSTVLITGATGKVGRRLIPILTRRGVTVRAANRSPVAPRAGIESVRFEWKDPGTYESARKGVDSIFLVASSIPGPEHAEYISTLLSGATGSGVKRVVFLSTFGIGEAPPEEPLRRIELAVELSGVPYTILRPVAFMQNFSEWHPLYVAEDIRLRDEIAHPGGEGRVSYVSSEDIAAVAAAALTDDAHAGKAYTLVGPEPMTLEQVADQISWVTGRQIKYVETDHRQLYAALLAEQTAPATAEHNSQLHAFAFSSGMMGVVNDEILTVTGRPPVSFGEFAAGAAAAWRR